MLAFLSLDRIGRPDCARNVLAERLWSEVAAKRAHASLRTALWRIRQAHPELIRAARDRVRLDETVEVDVHRTQAQATRLLSDDPELRPADTQITPLVGDLLPGWDEDWLLLERERIRQLQVHALEALSRRLRKLGRYSQAIDVAFAVIAAEPLRESGHTALIDTYLAEGNVAQAHQQLDWYASLLWRELGLDPSPALLDRMGVHAHRGADADQGDKRQPAQTFPHVLRRRHERLELVDGLGAGLDRTAASSPQYPDGLHRARTGLR
ncbi:AfsR/SARP family transcriptional regulator [Micromonospora kangleipakensis]|uniref:AfsR/SARP family transcriptional regulator n=1 Tax=Micromonospora kangleipakensis TaxID=1077942 RepID=UPI001A92F100|nr:BTAD domain-containing putative transcriptional regulator [Micromonospora kangleipakensis]